MARITRKELKTDKFALEVEHTVTVLRSSTRRRSSATARIGLAVVLIVLG